MATSTALKAFAAELANTVDDADRERLISRAKMIAVNTAPESAFEPPIRTLGEYLASTIAVPPELVSPYLMVRGGVNATIGRAGKGKLSPMDSRILTPTGWITMADVEVGMRVSNPVTGGSSEVIGVYPQGNKPIYRVTLTDGAQLEVGLEHLWEVRKRGAWGEPSIMTTGELQAAGVRTGNGKRRFALPPIEPLEFVEGPLPISPWALGALIGDGSLSGKGVRFTSADSALADRLSDELGLPVNKHKGKYAYGVVESKVLKAHLLDLGLCVTSEAKFIPEPYLRASAASRIELLRGLMDTDGGSSGEFCSKSKRLVDDVVEVVRSLGGRAKCSPKMTTWTHAGEKRSGTAWRTRIKLPVGITPFWLERKASKWTNNEYTPTRFIDSIEYVGEKEAQCIMVDHHRHLYIGDDYVVTHNTVMNLNRALRWACGKSMFDGWNDSTGAKQLAPSHDLRILIIENEGAAGMFHRQMGIMLNAQGFLTEADQKLCKENILIWGEGGYSGLKFDDASKLDGVRAGIEKHKPDVVFVEPFRSLWKGEENSSTEMNVVVDALVGIATDYECGVQISHHERKGGSGEGSQEKMNSARGSSVLEGAVTTMENFESVKAGEYRELSWSKSRHSVPPNPVRMEWVPDSWWYQWVPENQLNEAIQTALRSNADEPMSVTDMSEALDESNTQKLRQIANQMVEDGKLKVSASVSDGGRSTGKRYRLPVSEDSEYGGLNI